MSLSDRPDRDGADRRMHEALDASFDGFALYTALRDAGSGEVVGLRLDYINKAGTADFGVPASALVGRDLVDFFPGGATNGLREALLEALETGSVARRRFSDGGPDGRGVVDSVQVRLDPNTVLSTWRDVTDLLRGEALLAAAYEETAAVRATLHTALEASADGFVVLDVVPVPAGPAAPVLLVVHANAASAAWSDVAADDAGGLPAERLVGRLLDSGLRGLVVESLDRGRAASGRLHLVDSDGLWDASVDATSAPVGGARVVITWRDATSDERTRRALEELRREAEHAATHDGLTGLPNRVLLRRRLRRALDECRPGDRVAVVFCDLDGFKQINDSHGHASGDAVLRATAQRLERAARRQDTAARLAGDEFVLVLTGLAPDWDGRAFLERVEEALAEPVWVESAVVRPRASLGATVADPHGRPQSDRDLDALLRSADQAMYRVKSVRRTGSSDT